MLPLKVVSSGRPLWLDAYSQQVHLDGTLRQRRHTIDSALLIIGSGLTPNRGGVCAIRS